MRNLFVKKEEQTEIQMIQIVNIQQIHHQMKNEEESEDESESDEATETETEDKEISSLLKFFNEMYEKPAKLFVKCLD